MKEFNDIEDLEQLLKPQCEFHASDKLKDEVIAKATDAPCEDELQPLL